jgi:hypothetical protein
MTTTSLRDKQTTRLSTAVSASLVATSIALMSTACIAGEPRAVLELFTSQGCSSCPPADKLIGELAHDSSVIALSMPVDYWDYLGWKDTLADSRFTARQRSYSKMRGTREVYTPQVIVNGTTHALGSDRTGIERAITDTKKRDGVMTTKVSASIDGGQLKVSLPEGTPASPHCEVWIYALTKAIPITIGRGENRGEKITYHNVVRNWLKVGDWTGKAQNWAVPLENVSRDGVDAAVVYVQDGTREKPGAMLGATYLPLK